MWGTDLQPGDAFHKGRRSGQGAKEGGAQDGHAVEGLGDVVGSGAARAHRRDRCARAFQLIGHVLGVQLQEGVVVVEQHDQQHIDLRYRAPESAAQRESIHSRRPHCRQTAEIIWQGGRRAERAHWQVEQASGAQSGGDWLQPRRITGKAGGQ